jgi:hypothetical protein
MKLAGSGGFDRFGVAIEAELACKNLLTTGSYFGNLDLYFKNNLYLSR